MLFYSKPFNQKCMALLLSNSVILSYDGICKYSEISSRTVDHLLFSRTYVLFHNCIRHDQLLMLGCAPLEQFTACKANDKTLAIRCGELLFRLTRWVLVGKLGRYRHASCVFLLPAFVFVRLSYLSALPPEWLNASTLDKDGQREH